MHWSSSWPMVKEMALTTVGLCLIVEQTITGALTAHIQTQILVTGLALTGGGAAVHIGKFITAQLSGPQRSQGSHSAGSSPELEPSPHGGTDE